MIEDKKNVLMISYPGQYFLEQPKDEFDYLNSLTGDLLDLEEKQALTFSLIILTIDGRSNFDKTKLDYFLSIIKNVLSKMSEKTYEALSTLYITRFYWQKGWFYEVPQNWNEYKNVYILSPYMSHYINPIFNDLEKEKHTIYINYFNNSAGLEESELLESVFSAFKSLNLHNPKFVEREIRRIFFLIPHLFRMVLLGLISENKKNQENIKRFFRPEIDLFSPDLTIELSISVEPRKDYRRIINYLNSLKDIKSMFCFDEAFISRALFHFLNLLPICEENLSFYKKFIQKTISEDGLNQLGREKIFNKFPEFFTSESFEILSILFDKFLSLYKEIDKTFYKKMKFFYEILDSDKIKLFKQMKDSGKGIYIVYGKDKYFSEFLLKDLFKTKIKTHNLLDEWYNISIQPNEHIILIDNIDSLDVQQQAHVYNYLKMQENKTIIIVARSIPQAATISEAKITKIQIPILIEIQNQIVLIIYLFLQKRAFINISQYSWLFIIVVRTFSFWDDNLTFKGLEAGLKSAIKNVDERCSFLHPFFWYYMLSETKKSKLSDDVIPEAKYTNNTRRSYIKFYKEHWEFCYDNYSHLIVDDGNIRAFFFLIKRYNKEFGYKSVIGVFPNTILEESIQKNADQKKSKKKAQKVIRDGNEKKAVDKALRAALKTIKEMEKDRKPRFTDIITIKNFNLKDESVKFRSKDILRSTFEFIDIPSIFTEIKPGKNIFKIYDPKTKKNTRSKPTKKVNKNSSYKSRKKLSEE